MFPSIYFYLQYQNKRRRTDQLINTTLVSNGVEPIKPQVYVATLPIVLPPAPHSTDLRQEKIGRVFMRRQVNSWRFLLSTSQHHNALSFWNVAFHLNHGRLFTRSDFWGPDLAFFRDLQWRQPRGRSASRNSPRATHNPFWEKINLMPPSSRPYILAMKRPSPESRNTRNR